MKQLSPKTTAAIYELIKQVLPARSASPSEHSLLGGHVLLGNEDFEVDLQCTLQTLVCPTTTTSVFTAIPKIPRDSTPEEVTDEKWSSLPASSTYFCLIYPNFFGLCDNTVCL